MKHIVLVLLIVFVAVCGVASSQVLFGQGDFDYDGDVDYKDFIVFARNFGKPFDLQTKYTPVIDTLVVVKTDTVTITKTVPFDGRGPLLRAAHLLGYWVLHIQKQPGLLDSTRTLPICFNFISDVEPDGEYWISGKPLVSYFNTSSGYGSIDVELDVHVKWTYGPFKTTDEDKRRSYSPPPYHFSPPPGGYYRLIMRGHRGFLLNTEIIFLIEYEEKFIPDFRGVRIAEPSVKILGVRGYGRGNYMDPRTIDTEKCYLKQVSWEEYRELYERE